MGTQSPLGPQFPWLCTREAGQHKGCRLAAHRPALFETRQVKALSQSTCGSPASPLPPNHLWWEQRAHPSPLGWYCHHPILSLPPTGWGCAMATHPSDPHSRDRCSSPPAPSMACVRAGSPQLLLPSLPRKVCHPSRQEVRPHHQDGEVCRHDRRRNRYSNPRPLLNPCQADVMG